MKNIENLVRELIKLPTETEWVEFKENNTTPEVLGKTICALANAATYNSRNCAYMVYGINDITHEIVGTTFDYRTYKKGNEEIINWLRQKLSDNANFEFNDVEIEGKHIVVIIVSKAIEKSVMFDKVEYIRVGSYVKPLNDNPSMKMQLWDRLRSSRFEDLPAKEDMSISEVLNMLDYSKYFDLRKIQMVTSPDQIIHYLQEESLIKKQDDGQYTITNLAAILFAKKLSDFPTVSRKAIRLVQYKGKNKLEMLREFTGNKGYAIGFEALIDFISALLPMKEEIIGAKRVTVSAYPMIAIREIIANALIHQDLSITGTGPIVEIYENRIEVTNAGKPLVDIDRIIDNPSKSRNEKLASAMRKLKMCEEVGSGWDKIAMSCEHFRLPAPKMFLYEENTQVVIYQHVDFSNILPEDKIHACYIHACTQQVNGDVLTNSSLRERFGLPETSAASISRLIKDCVEKERIRPVDPDTAPKHKKYLPYWA